MMEGSLDTQTEHMLTVGTDEEEEEITTGQLDPHPHDTHHLMALGTHLFHLHSLFTVQQHTDVLPPDTTDPPTAANSLKIREDIARAAYKTWFQIKPNHKEVKDQWWAL